MDDHGGGGSTALLQDKGAAVVSRRAHRSASGAADAASTRRRLLEAGVEVFRRKGIEAASVHEVVRLAGTSTPALYYHFGSKHGLVLAVLEDCVRRVIEAAAEAVALPGSSSVRLAALCEGVRRVCETDWYLLSVADRPDPIRATLVPGFDFNRTGRALAAAFERILGEGEATGEFTVEDHPVLQFVLVSLALGTTWQQHEDRLPTDRLLRPVLARLTSAPQDGSRER